MSLALVVNIYGRNIFNFDIAYFVSDRMNSYSKKISIWTVKMDQKIRISMSMVFDHNFFHIFTQFFFLEKQKLSINVAPP